MAVVGLALLGSRARGDHDDGADVDLLAVTREDAPATTTHDRVTISSYPLSQVVRSAQAGDLFALHIASEAKVLYEAWPLFAEIRGAFTYRADYSREITLASDLGWFLLRHGHHFVDGKALNQKVAWCTRTMVIAKAATQRRAIFSAIGLAEFSGSADVLTVIKNKDSAAFSPSMMHVFRRVLVAVGAGMPPRAGSLIEQQQVFEADRNVPGVRAVRAVMSSPLVFQ